MDVKTEKRDRERKEGRVSLPFPYERMGALILTTDHMQTLKISASSGL